MQLIVTIGVILAIAGGAIWVACISNLDFKRSVVRFYRKYLPVSPSPHLVPIANLKVTIISGRLDPECPPDSPENYSGICVVLGKPPNQRIHYAALFLILRLTNQGEGAGMVERIEIEALSADGTW